MFRVLVVDDSPTAREILTEILNSDAEIEVVGTGHDGHEAVRLTEQLRPDVVTMDIQMPNMDGFEATKEIMIETPTPIVIVSASGVIEQVEASMRALRVGALAVLRKPPSPASLDFEKLAKEIVETVKAMAEVKVVRHRRYPGHEALVKPSRIQRSKQEVRVVAIATSTGGPPALQQVFAELPADYPLPILVVQHIAEGFTDGFAQWLNSTVPPRVKVAERGELLAAGTIYIAPQDHHFGASRSGNVMLSSDPPVGGFRPAATYLFQSVAEAYGSAALAIILTGMGRDGVDGLRAIRAAGGRIIAQDEESCVVFGMPGAAVAEGLADRVVPLPAISSLLVDVAKHKSA